MTPPRRYFFVHLQKTGGTALFRRLRHHFGVEAVYPRPVIETAVRAIVGLLLLVAPNLLDFADVGGAAVWVPRIVGLMILLQALMTDYELGLIKVLPIGMHLLADYVVGLVLLASPWLFNFSGRSREATITVVVVGILVLGVTAMTEPRTSRERYATVPIVSDATGNTSAEGWLKALSPGFSTATAGSQWNTVVENRITRMIPTTKSGRALASRPNPLTT